MANIHVDRRKQFLQRMKDGEPVDDAYDDWARCYDEDVRTRLTAAYGRFCDVIDNIFQGNKQINILDFGSGTGYAGKKLTERGYTNIDAVDASKEMLKIANDFGIYKKSYCQLVGPTPLPIEDGTYDCVLGVGVIAPKHFELDAVSDLCRLVKKGGCFIVQGSHKMWNESAEFYVDMAAMLQKMVDENKMAQVTWRVIDGYAKLNEIEEKGLLFVYEKL